LEGIKGANYSEMVKFAQNAAGKHNLYALSNAALMNIVPLAIWCSRLESDGDVEYIIRSALKITFPNKTVIEAVTCYCLAIRHLLNNKNSQMETFRLVDWWIKRHCMDSDVEEWWEDVKKGHLVSASTDMMSIRIPWTNAFILLQDVTLSYADVIKKIIEEGGDTDTNACIVGGMIGAAVGYTAIYEKNEKQIDTMMKCDVSTGEYPRPKLYTPKFAFDKVIELINMAPLTLEE